MALFRRKIEPVIVSSEYTTDGILLTIERDQEPVDLPINLTVSEIKSLTNLSQLQLLEDLYFDQFLSKEATGQYTLPYKEIYRLTDDEREFIDLPKDVTPLSIKLTNKSFVGSKDFKLVAELRSTDYVNLHKIGERIGPIIQLPNKDTLLIDETTYEFLHELDQQPESTNKDKIFSYIAKIKKHAEALNIELSEHLKREDYAFIEDVSIDLSRDDTGIEFMPKFDLDNIEGISNDLDFLNQHYTKAKNKRVFVDPNTQETAKKIKQLEPITNENIPAFVENPEAFLPEDIGISLDDLSERVRSLGIRVYKARPFIHANKSDRGWFEYETGYKIEDHEGNEQTVESEEFFADNDQTNFKQLDENTFVKVPEQAASFHTLSEQLKSHSNESPSEKAIPASYIVEIFENIDGVEFNQPIHELRDELKDNQVFETQPPKTFNAILKPFQTDGFVWLKSLYFAGYGGLLADDMGLGKTIQVVAFLSYLKANNKLGPTLLVLPKSLIDNWLNEMQKFSPSLLDNPYVHMGTNRLKDAKLIAEKEIVLTTYQTLVRDQLNMAKVDWQMVICDEAQAIKNPTTAASIVVRALKNKGRIALTGTPVENTLSELWAIVDFVQPGTLGSLKEFKAKYESKYIEEADYSAIQKEIEAKLHLIYKRRTKSHELKNQLPDKNEHKLSINLGKEQRRLYASVLAGVKSKEIVPLQGIMHLKMLSSHPGLIDQSLTNLPVKKVPKLQKTIEILSTIQEKQEKVIIFTEYREMQAILKRAVAETFKIVPNIINGTTNGRQSVVDEFNQKPGFDILILSPKAAGTGLTITGANHVIHYTRWWNPAVENQATDRVYRIGQEKNVEVYYPIIKDTDSGRTVEEVVDQLLSEKKELAENVITPSKNLNIEQEILHQVAN